MKFLNKTRVGLVAVANAFVFAVSVAASESPGPDLRASSFDVEANGGAGIELVMGRTGGGWSLRLFHARVNRDATVSEPVLVPTDHAVPGGHHHGNAPQVAGHGDRVMVLWTARGGGPFGSGPLGVSLSDDGGRSWRPGPVPVALETSSATTGYRFPAALATPEGFHVVWIHAAGEERSLRYSRLKHGEKSWSTPVVLDATSCACCWNELRATGDGRLMALYRDEDPRDLALAVSEDGGVNWRRTGPVGDVGWQFKGCPHVGGGLGVAARGAGNPHFLVASGWSGQPEKTGAYLLSSQDGGESWSPMTGLGDRGKNTDAAVLDERVAAVVWDQPAENGTAVQARFSRDGGKTWEAARRLSAPGRPAKYPRVVAWEGKAHCFWSEGTGAEERVMILRLDPGTSGRQAALVP